MGKNDIIFAADMSLSDYARSYPDALHYKIFPTLGML